MKNIINYSLLLLLIIQTSCSDNKNTNTYIPVKETTDPYDLDGREMLVTKNITMQPKTFVNTVTNDSVRIIHHLENTGFHFYNAVAFADEKKGAIVGGAGLRIRTTTDGGLHWQENRFSKFANAFQSLSVQSDTIFSVGESKYIYKSTNFGKDWSIFDTNMLINNYLNNENDDFPKRYNPRYYKIKFYKNIGFIVGNYYKDRKIIPILLKTVDKGKSWQILKLKGLLTFETEISNMAILSEKVLYIVTLKGNCYKSTDAGATWKLKYRNINTPLKSIDFITKNEGFIGGDSVLWHTNSGAKIWNKIPLPLHKNFNISNIHFINNQKAIFTIFSKSGKLDTNLLYQIDSKTKAVKSIFSKKDTTVIPKGEVYGLFYLKNSVFVLDRNNLYQLKI